MPPVKNSHCSWCGTRFADGPTWPKSCTGCGKTTWLNPLPVAVLVLPVDDGVLLIRRGIEPNKGKLAFPGGFIELEEAWQDAAARELREETGIDVPGSEVRDHRVLSAPDGTVLIFGVASRRSRADLPPFRPTNETTELVIATKPEPLAFPLHERVLRDWFVKP